MENVAICKEPAHMWSITFNTRNRYLLLTTDAAFRVGETDEILAKLLWTPGV